MFLTQNINTLSDYSREGFCFKMGFDRYSTANEAGNSIATKEQGKEYGYHHHTKSSCEMDNGFSWTFWRERRYVVAILSFFGYFVMFCLRINLSVAVVAMTTKRPILTENSTLAYVRDFDWNTEIQGLLLSSFYYGYIFTQLLGGWLAGILGGHVVVGLGIGLSAFATMFNPVAAYYGPYLLGFLKILDGFFHGVTLPAFSVLLAQWAPPLERSRLSSIAISGIYAGTVFCFPVSGLIAQYLDWESIFYITGTMGLLWLVVWFLVVKRDPENDPNISREELEYITSSLAQEEQSKILFLPWKKILTSVPVWANVTAAVVQNWGFYTFSSQMPMFLEGVLHFTIEDSGYLSSLPYIMMFFTIQIGGITSDWLESKEIISKTTIRKLFICIPFTCQMALVSVAGYLSSPAEIIACLTFAVTLESFTWSTISVNQLDLSSQHAGVIMGLAMTLGTLPGILSPTITGFIVTEQTEAQWRIVFLITGGIYLFGLIVFGIFANGEKQNWTDNDKDTNGIFVTSITKREPQK